MWIKHCSLLIVIAVHIQGIAACSYGNDLTQLTSSSRSGLIVNTANVAPCPGYATTWNMCYYSSTTDQSSIYTVYLGVYRPSSSGPKQYNLVSGAPYTISTPQTLLNYSCISYSMTQSQQFMVQSGDIIAACVQPFGSGRLGIVASTSGTTQIPVKPLPMMSAMCGPLSSTLPSPITGTGTGFTLRSIALHVSLDVNECAVNNGVMNCLAITSSTVPTSTVPTSTVPTSTVPTSTVPTSTVATSTVATSYSASPSCSTLTALSTAAFPYSSEADQSAAIAASVVTVIVLIAVVITVVAILLLLYVKRSSKVTISGRAQSNVFDNVAYGDNAVQINTYDEAKAVYEPVKDNETSEVKGLGYESYEVPYNASNTYSIPDSNELLGSENIYGNDDEDPYCMPPSQEKELYGQLKQQNTLKIPRHEIQTQSSLGHGQFGGVHIGKWRTPKWEREVAIKMLDPTTSHQDDKVKFLQEAAIMAQFKHPNVIQLYGIVTDGQPLMLVIELAHNKDLRTHLMTLRPDPGLMIQSHIPQCLLTYSQQVALGMQYLSSKSFVHRDLAARNVLLTKTCVCKIADFGLSRNLDEENYYFSHGGMIPVKWTAPEAISYKKYSTASDVWSFGCVLYEIWSLGFKPFEGLSNAEVVAKVDTGYRLPPPPGCPLLVYQTMIHCWSPNEHSRPSFRDIHLSLSQNQEHVLQIPEEAASTHPQAAVLGAPLEAGEKMYMEIQNSYLK